MLAICTMHAGVVARRPHMGTKKGERTIIASAGLGQPPSQTSILELEFPNPATSLFQFRILNSWSNVHSNRGFEDGVQAFDRVL